MNWIESIEGQIASIVTDFVDMSHATVRVWAVLTLANVTWTVSPEPVWMPDQTG